MRQRFLRDLFRDLYCADGSFPDLSDIRIHRPNAANPGWMWGARALTVGADIYFRPDCYAPDTPAGLWLLAHEVAHVIQQRRGPVESVRVDDGWAVAPCDRAEEREADAAAEAVLAGRPFVFGPPSAAATRIRRTSDRVVQRFTVWEHLLLANLDPRTVSSVIPDTGALRGTISPSEVFAQLEKQCTVTEELAKAPVNVDTDRLREEFPELQTIRLSGSGLVVTGGELNILPDYFSHPAQIDAAPASFIVPVIQAIRSQNCRELNRIMGRSKPSGRKFGTMRYPKVRAFPGIRKAIEIDALGKRCQLLPSERFLSVLARNACHFAPFSWYRWQSFHLLARQMIAHANTKSGGERERLRSAAQVYAGYADHFLQDSFAAGHLANKTLVMQWYIEWLTESGASFADRALLSEMTYQRQPFLHGPDLYYPQPGEDGQRMYPKGNTDPCAITDPQSATEALTLEARIEQSGISGDTPEDKLQGYLCYQALLASSVAQLSANIVHDYFNKRSLVVASCADGSSYRTWGDRTLLVGRSGLLKAASAVDASRRAIQDLLTRGETDITSSQIFNSVPSHVEINGVMLTLRQWHDADLKDLCFRKLFGLTGTRVRKALLGLAARDFGVPSADYTELRRSHIINASP